MKNSRRQFIKHTATLGLGVGLLPHLNFSAEAAPLPPFDDSENYWTMLRSQFPLSQGLIYLNNGTMGPSPYSVLNAVQQEMVHIDTQGHYGGYEEEAIAALARFLGSDKEEISLTRNVTEGINIICWGLRLNKGDEILITTHEHVGHATPWLNKLRLDGIILKPLPLGASADESLEIIRKGITSKTKLIAIPHIPCTIGQIMPVKAICDLAKSKGILTFIDGAHPPGMLNINLHDIGCDFYAGCCHKWMLGPKGTGFLYVNKNRRDAVQAYYMGGGTDAGWDMLSQPPVLKGYIDNGHRFYYGTQNAALFKGVIKAIEFHEQIGKDQIEKRVKALSAYLQDHLLKMRNMEMLTPTEDLSRGAQIGFKIKDKEMSDLRVFLAEKKIIARYVPENNINNLRLSTHIYNTYAEIDVCLKAIDEFAMKP